jgi:hypothetical protein
MVAMIAMRCVAALNRAERKELETLFDEWNLLY